MKCGKKDLLLYAVTDRYWLGKQTLYEQVESALKGGATFIQLREKELDYESFLKEALEIKELCHRYNVPFVINDNVEIACKTNADGIHVWQSDMNAKNVRKLIGNNKILGVSVQTVEQAVLAEKHGADYLGVGAVFHTDSKSDADFVSFDTLNAICNAVKIGMVPTKELIEVTAKKLNEYNASNIVVDPVMVATSGSTLIEYDAILALINNLFPIATLITPNIPEAEVISQIKIKTKEDMIKAAKIIYTIYGCSVLLKGGHSLNDANDLLYKNGEYTWFESKRIDNPNTHGTGCTLSSAIAANLSKGFTLENSVKNSKAYVQKALSLMLDLGKGSGPINHMLK